MRYRYTTVILWSLCRFRDRSIYGRHIVLLYFTDSSSFYFIYLFVDLFTGRMIFFFSVLKFSPQCSDYNLHRDFIYEILIQ